MDLAARRPHISAGVALAGAAVLATGPITQHLPKLDVAQHLPQVSVTNINLTDAASSMIDLFSGVENELASLASGVGAATVPADALNDILNPVAQNLIVQTWSNTFQTAMGNLQVIGNTWSATPFPVLQQIAANGMQYGIDYVGDYQGAATRLVNLVPTFGPAIQKGITQIASGQVYNGIFGMYQALFQQPILQLLPLEAVLRIPYFMAQNLANGLNYLTTTGIQDLGSYALSLPTVAVQGFGQSLQAVSDAWHAGDQVGAVTNLINTPGAMLNTLLNGFNSSGKNFPLTGGLLSSPFESAKFGRTGQGLINQILNTDLPALAKQMVAPNAQNIAAGGSLTTEIQNLANQLINGWPSLNNAISGITSDVTGSLTSMLQSIPSVLSSLPSVLGNLGGMVATQVGAWIAAIFRLI